MERLSVAGDVRPERTKKLSIAEATGALVDDPAGQRILRIPSHNYRFFIYRRDGAFLGTVPGPSQIRAPQEDPTTGAVMPNASDEVYNVVRLPSNEFAAQVIRRDVDGSAEGAIDVLDGNLRAETTGIPISEGYGLLAGASGDGSLYFTGFGPWGMLIIKARIVRQ